MREPPFSGSSAAPSQGVVVIVDYSLDLPLPIDALRTRQLESLQPDAILGDRPDALAESDAREPGASIFLFPNGILILRAEDGQMWGFSWSGTVSDLRRQLSTDQALELTWTVPGLPPGGGRILCQAFVSGLFCGVWNKVELPPWPPCQNPNLDPHNIQP